MDKIDFKKALASLYKAPSDRFVAVDVPEMQFVKVDGAGDPNTAPAYNRAIEWLYSTSYALKFAVKAAGKLDYGVPPLEGLWWADDPADFAARRKDRWRWTMMIMAPNIVDRPSFEAAVEKSKKKLGDPPASLRLERFTEGRSLQILHVGSYDDEAPTLARLHDEVMPSQGLTFAGRHHEIYLSDARRTAPAKLKTILRQPVKAAE
ncbi:MAG: hypothetical protein BGN99_31815 [Alphaproteobacteria bacterium 65-37]|nr:GyrI-like domain-containing protein [Alphaproteobacteria bacterium]OJU44386.1 MAG: hypothetical protein BGN99_31815 [Alphaproteobacteria bacterium 65-37]